VNPDRRLRVLVVDDHEVVHWGLRALLAEEPWVERYLAARSSKRALELARRYEPHVALVDVLLGAELGTTLCAELRTASPITRVLLVSGARRISKTATSVAGAAGFVSKDCAAQDIVAAVRMVGMGLDVLLAPESPPEAPSARLSEREEEVLRLLATGTTIREIAGELFLSPYTVKDHIKSLYRKLGARNRADAVLRAERVGLLV
jgi:DNA-binding NarL/FixJ family response regulator